jgi:hypothetical protein
MGRPVFAKARRLDPDKLRKAEAEFRELEAEGIIRRSDSPWSSPLHMVRKKDRSWRSCGDYRRLNLAMTHDRYGTVNFYRWFLPGIARTLQLLTDALKGAPKTLEWPPPPSERPRRPWRLRYHWRTQPRTPCSLSQQTPRTHTSAACFNS